MSIYFKHYFLNVLDIFNTWLNVSWIILVALVVHYRSLFNYIIIVILEAHHWTESSNYIIENTLLEKRPIGLVLEKGNTLISNFQLLVSFSSWRPSFKNVTYSYSSYLIDKVHSQMESLDIHIWCEICIWCGSSKMDEIHLACEELN